MIKLEMVMFKNNWINNDVEKYMKFTIFLWNSERLQMQFILQKFDLVISEENKYWWNGQSDKRRSWWNFMQIIW